MPEFRKDPLTHRWVIFAPERANRPRNFSGQSTTFCPFCVGNESETPPAVLVYPQKSDAIVYPDLGNWRLRVVPNRFPALANEGRSVLSVHELSETQNGFGVHEVIIESPDHFANFATFSIPEMEDVLSAYQKRLNTLHLDERIRYIMVFKNHGEKAGASLEHPHTQLLALPMIPVLVQEELTILRAHYEKKGSCIYCDLVKYEQRVLERVIYENADFLVFAPYAPSFPFETYIVPKQHEPFFEARGRYTSLAQALSILFKKFHQCFDPFPYNLILHNAPYREEDASRFHWHIEIMPILSSTAGFERGSGCYINTCFPEEAAKILRAIKV